MMESYVCISTLLTVAHSDLSLRVMRHQDAGLSRIAVFGGMMDPDAFDGIVGGRMHFVQVFTILNEIAGNAEIMGSAITEHLPWSVIDFAKVLNALPLLGNRERASRAGHLTGIISSFGYHHGGPGALVDFNY
jgi:hypothetical protein